jgi:hypothetical protein
MLVMLRMPLGLVFVSRREEEGKGRRRKEKEEGQGRTRRDKEDNEGQEGTRRGRERAQSGYDEFFFVYVP